MDYKEAIARWLFWSRPETWPADWGDAVFLARALNEMGGLLYGDLWQGDEPYLSVIPKMPPVEGTADLGADDWQAIRGVLCLTRRWDMNDGAEAINDRLVELEDYEAALAFCNENGPGAAERDKRFGHALSFLSSGIAEGHVRSMTQGINGGGYVELPADAWKTTYWRPRYVLCALNRQDPFASVYWSSQHQWLFVSRADLDAFKAKVFKTENVEAGQKPAPEIEAPSPAQDSALSKRRQRPQQTRVRPLLQQLYPDGVPSREALTDTQLVKDVSDIAPKPLPSKETILRAAGRMP